MDWSKPLVRYGTVICVAILCELVVSKLWQQEEKNLFLILGDFILGCLQFFISLLDTMALLPMLFLSVIGVYQILDRQGQMRDDIHALVAWFNFPINSQDTGVKKWFIQEVKKLRQECEELKKEKQELRSQKEKLAEALDAEEAKNQPGAQSQVQVRNMYQNKISDLTTEMQTMTTVKYMQETLKALDAINPPTYRVHDEEKLKAIGTVFVSTVIPMNILHKFHAYDTNVLVQQDIEKVTRLTDNHGRARGAAELLSILPAYQGWYECLLQVLRDPLVKQGHVANMFEEAVAEAERNREEEAAVAEQGRSAAAAEEETVTPEELQHQMQTLYNKTISAMKSDMKNLTERDKIREAMGAVRAEGSRACPVYHENIVKKIRTLFVSFVNPLNVLHVFHKYNRDVLVQQDIDEVTRMAENHGKHRGAAELLSRLPRYQNWFPCLLQVLRDRVVKQGHVAEYMERNVAENVSNREVTQQHHETEVKTLHHDGAMEGELQELQRDFSQAEPVLLQRIRPFFVHDVDPQNVLHLIHAYDPSVLVEEDIQEVHRITEQHGTIKGAGEMLNRLFGYRGWLSCIVNVLRDPTVLQDHEADKIEYVIENLENDEQDRNALELKTFWEKKYRTEKEKSENSQRIIEELKKKIQYLEGRLPAEEKLLLAGKTGYGKSATGNSILLRRCFRSSGISCVVTTEHSCEVSDFESTHIQVVDGPGIDPYDDNTSTSIYNPATFMTRALQSSPDGFDALLLVIRFGGRFRREDEDVIESLKRVCTPNFSNIMSFLVMTCGDIFNMKAEEENITLEQWCSQQYGYLGDLLSEVEGRVVLFDNATIDEAIRHQQVRQLLDMVRCLRKKRTRFTASDLIISKTE